MCLERVRYHRVHVRVLNSQDRLPARQEEPQNADSHLHLDVFCKTECVNSLCSIHTSAFCLIKNCIPLLSVGRFELAGQAFQSTV